MKVKSLSRVRLFATSWTVAYQAPPSMEFSRQEYWSGLPFPSPGDLHMVSSRSIHIAKIATYSFLQLGSIPLYIYHIFLWIDIYTLWALPWWLRWKSICLQFGRPGINPWDGKIPWRRKWQTTPELLPGKPHGQRSLVGYSP